MVSLYFGELEGCTNPNMNYIVFVSVKSMAVFWNPKLSNTRKTY
jgi:hypothetical protein